MNKDIMRRVGFEKEIDLVEQKKCPFCRKPVDTSDFRDTLSAREFMISGLCQACQDKTFGVER